MPIRSRRVEIVTQPPFLLQRMHSIHRWNEALLERSAIRTKHRRNEASKRKRLDPFDRAPLSSLSFLIKRLPGEVSKGFIRVSHTVGIFSFGNRSTFFAVRGHQFVRKLLVGGSALFVANSTEHPAKREALLAALVDLHRHLVRSTTDTFRPDFDIGLYGFDGLFENFDRRSIFDLFSDFVQRAIEDALGGILLSVVHQAIDELRCQNGIEPRVRPEARAGSCNFAHKFETDLLKKLWIGFWEIRPSSRRIGCETACDRRPREYLGCLEPLDSEHQANREHDHLEREQSSAPGDCGPHRECTR